MRSVRILTCVCVGLLGALLPRAKASQQNQKTTFTFSKAVEVPGQVLLPGTYVFKLADSIADRNIVQVYNKTQTHLLGTFLAIPDYHLVPSGKAIITFEERAAGAPEAVRAWFYPGDNYGHEFVYPKAKAMELAKTNKQPVASMPDELSANTTKATGDMNEPAVMAMKQAPLKAQQPNEQETEVAEAFAHPPATEQAAAAPEALPKTASPFPLIALLGLAALGGAGALRFARRKQGSATR